MYKAFDSNKLTNNDYIGLGSYEKQHLLFSCVYRHYSAHFSKIRSIL